MLTAYEEERRALEMYQRLRLQAEGSDWQRDKGETLLQWVLRCIEERKELRKKAQPTK